MFRVTRNALALSMAPLLSGCLLTQQGPKLQQDDARPFVVGVVLMEDTQIANQGGVAMITGRFVKITEKKTDPVNAVYPHRQSQRVASIMQNLETQKTATSANPCRVGKGKREPNNTLVRDEQPQFLSMGNVKYGPALSGQPLTPLDRTKNNVYAALLEPDFPAMAFEITAEGEGKVAGFEHGYLSMPEHLKWVRFNGYDFGDLRVEHKRGDGFKAEWKMPTINNTQNIMLLKVVAHNDTENFLIECEARESDFADVNGLKSWELEKELFAELPQKAQIGVQLTRAHQIIPPFPLKEIRLQGFRNMYSELRLNE